MYAFRELIGATLNHARSLNAQIIGEELERITAAYDGRLTPVEVIDTARAEVSPLHQHFEWDDGIAAERWRLVQARQLINSIRIVADDDGVLGQTQRAYLSIAADGRAYRRVSDVIGNRDLELRVLLAAERELASFEQRYRALTEICTLVHRARTQISERRRQREETRASA